jgi:hypothetical protein
MGPASKNGAELLNALPDSMTAQQDVTVSFWIGVLEFLAYAAAFLPLLVRWSFLYLRSARRVAIPPSDG